MVALSYLLLFLSFVAWLGVFARLRAGNRVEVFAWASVGVLAQVVFVTLALGLFWNHYRRETVLALDGTIVAAMLALRGGAAIAFLRDVAAAVPAAARAALHRPLVLLALGLIYLPWFGALEQSFGFPDPGWDATNYHFPMALFTIQEEGLAFFDSRCGHTNEFPKNIQFLFARFFLFSPSETPHHFVQWMAGFVAVAALYGWLRAWKVPRWLASVFASLLLTIQAALLQVIATWGTIDLAFTSLILVAWGALGGARGVDDQRRLIVVALAASLAIGARGQGLYLGGLAFLFGAVRLWQWRGRGFAMPLRYAVFATGCAMVFATVHYARNWKYYGNPFHPVETRLFGHVFPGHFKSVDEVIRTKDFTKADSSLEALFPSWRKTKLDRWARMRVPVQGQFGFAWIWALLPGWTMAVGVLFWRRAWFDGAFLGVVLAFLFLAPGNWWGRFALPYVGLSTVAVGWLLSLLKPRIAAGIAATVTTLALYSGWELYSHHGIWKRQQDLRSDGPFDTVLSTYEGRPPATDAGKVYFWVFDNLPAGATLVHYQRDYYPILEYFLFNREKTNRLYGLGTAGSSEEFREQLRARGATHVLTRVDEPPVDDFAAALCGAPLFEANIYRLYAVPDNVRR